MTVVELIGLAGSFSLLAGWRVYLCVFAAGLAMNFGWLPLPDHLQELSAIQSPWVIGAAFTAMILEFFADKVAWVDSVWDGIHTAIRPVGGALLSLAVVDPSEPVWQVVCLILGGGLALAGHSVKSGTRAAVNLSPEPFSNIAVSSGEDLTSLTILAAILANPELAIVLFALLLVATIVLLIVLRQMLHRARGMLRFNDISSE